MLTNLLASSCVFDFILFRLVDEYAMCPPPPPLLLLLLQVSVVTVDPPPAPVPCRGGLPWAAAAAVEDPWVSSMRETALRTWSDIRSRLSVLFALRRRAAAAEDDDDDPRPHSIEADLPRHPYWAPESESSSSSLW